MEDILIYILYKNQFYRINSVDLCHIIHLIDSTGLLKTKEEQPLIFRQVQKIQDTTIYKI